MRYTGTCDMMGSDGMAWQQAGIEYTVCCRYLWAKGLRGIVVRIYTLLYTLHI